jgi:hypothetical protein
MTGQVEPGGGFAADGRASEGAGGHVGAPLLQKLATLLSDYPGHAFCDECLAQRLAVKTDLAWSAALELAESPDFQVDVGFCSQCLDRLEDVAHVRWTSSTPEPARGQAEKPRIRFTPPA